MPSSPLPLKEVLNDCAQAQARGWLTHAITETSTLWKVRLKKKKKKRAFLLWQYPWQLTFHLPLTARPWSGTRCDTRFWKARTSDGTGPKIPAPTAPNVSATCSKTKSVPWKKAGNSFLYVPTDGLEASNRTHEGASSCFLTKRNRYPLEEVAWLRRLSISWRLLSRRHRTRGCRSSLTRRDSPPSKAAHRHVTLDSSKMWLCWILNITEDNW